MIAAAHRSLDSCLRSRLNNSLASTGIFFSPGNPAITPTIRFREHLENLAPELEIDPVALCEFPSHYAFFGSRTILRNIRRSDWYTENCLERLDAPVELPTHGHRIVPPEQASTQLIELLLDETRARIKDCQHVGLLLSGGMDSRIVAAAIGELQRSRADIHVTCFTWGQEGTRDVAYARQIARYYGWNFERFEINAATLWDNVIAAAEEGCFHSALHLHAMPAVANRALELNIDLMIAASYGDSIGRAEYSGLHVSSLPPIKNRMRNWYGIFDEGLFNCCKSQSFVELDRCHRLYGKVSNASRNELDFQLHYMRNMLGSAMNVIDSRVPLAQAFTSRPLVEYMWSLDVKCRTDEIYLFVLRQIAPELLDIPWARTGKPFLVSKARPDHLRRNFHDYPNWMRENIDHLEKAIFSGAIENFGAFNARAIQAIFNAFKQYRFVRSGRIPEILLWLASFGVLLEKYDPTPIRQSPRGRRLWPRYKLELYGTLLRQYKAFGWQQER